MKLKSCHIAEQPVRKYKADFEHYLTKAAKERVIKLFLLVLLDCREVSYKRVATFQSVDQGKLLQYIRLLRHGRVILVLFRDFVEPRVSA